MSLLLPSYGGNNFFKQMLLSNCLIGIINARLLFHSTPDVLFISYRQTMVLMPKSEIIKQSIDGMTTQNF